VNLVRKSTSGNRQHSRPIYTTRIWTNVRAIERFSFTGRVRRWSRSLLCKQYVSMFRTFWQFFAEVKRNLHIVILLDTEHPRFGERLQTNPSLYNFCTVLWRNAPSRDLLIQVKLWREFLPDLNFRPLEYIWKVLKSMWIRHYWKFSASFTTPVHNKFGRHPNFPFFYKISPKSIDKSRRRWKRDWNDWG
jgi:hypothetical protein